MDNVGHFADAARALATDHELWESTSRSARAHAVSSFSTSTFIENHIKMYCAVLDNK
jgi:glycosyltransferase involved in cell wall biosynthesis